MYLCDPEFIFLFFIYSFDGRAGMPGFVSDDLIETILTKSRKHLHARSLHVMVIAAPISSLGQLVTYLEVCGCNVSL